MTFKLTFVSERQHLVVDTRRITDTQDRHTAVDKFLANPVDSRIALRADKHLRFTVERFVDGLDESRGLARSGGP